MTRLPSFFLKSSGESAVSLTPLQRVFLGVSGLGVLAVFLLSYLVQPDPRGFGTHQQFGLPPCGFQVIFGMPCPSCGGTTSFAHFVRGEWTHAMRANLGAFALGCVGVLFVPWAWSCSWQGKWTVFHRPSVAALAVVLMLATLALGHWGFRIWMT